MLQYLSIHFSLYYLSSGCLREVKNERKFQTFSFKRCRGCLQEVPNNWSLRRGDCLRDVVTTGGSTQCIKIQLDIGV